MAILETDRSLSAVDDDGHFFHKPNLNSKNFGSCFKFLVSLKILAMNLYIILSIMCNLKINTYIRLGKTQFHSDSTVQLTAQQYTARKLNRKVYLPDKILFLTLASDSFDFAVHIVDVAVFQSPTK